MYEKIEKLCIKKGITISKLCQDINIRRSVLTELKAGRTKKLSATTLNKISDYFNVTVDYLVDRATEPETKKEPIVNTDRFTVDYYKLDAEDRETVDLMISTLLQKEKYQKASVG